MCKVAIALQAASSLDNVQIFGVLLECGNDLKSQVDEYCNAMIAVVYCDNCRKFREERYIFAIAISTSMGNRNNSK